MTRGPLFRVPLGVCAGIAPFNFPAMIPLWMFPLAIATGNTFVLKPSERVPSCAQRLVELMCVSTPDGSLSVPLPLPLLLSQSTRSSPAHALAIDLSHGSDDREEAGSPPGVVNIVHGSVDTVNFLCDEPRIKALSFVGSNQAGEHIYQRGSAAGKRVQVCEEGGCRRGGSGCSACERVPGGARATSARASTRAVFTRSAV